MINYIKTDYIKVRAAMLLLTNDKMPNWVSIILYILLLPIGIMLWPFAMLYMLYITKQIKKSDK